MTGGEERPGLPNHRPSPPCTPDPSEIRADWIAFYDAHFLRVVRLVMHCGGSLQDAQDAAQEAFTESLAMVTADATCWAAVAGKEGWIRTVALRRHQRPPGPRIRPLLAHGAAIPDQPHSDPGPDELSEQAQTVLQVLRSLPEEEQAVMAFSLDDFPTAEIAAALGMTQQKVRDLRKKARATLKATLGRHLPPEGRELR